MAKLLIGICLSIMAGTGATLLLKQQWPEIKSADERFYTFLLSGVFFQGLALALVHYFLSHHAVTWKEFLGIRPLRPKRPEAVPLRTGSDESSDSVEGRGVISSVDDLVVPSAGSNPALPPPEALANSVGSEQAPGPDERLTEDGAVDWKRAVLIGLGTSIVVLPAALALNELSKMMLQLFQDEVAVQPTLQVLHVADSTVRRMLFGFSAIVLAPVVEEILFRGIAYKAVYERGYRTLALVGSSVVFGMIHLNLMTFLPLTFFAMVLALLYASTRTLLAPIVAHASFNAINFTLYLVTTR